MGSLDLYGMLSNNSRTNVYIQQAYGNIWNQVSSSGTGSFQTIFRQAGLASGQSSTSISTPMDDIFEEASKTYGVDVNLLKAIGKAESNFNADATSQAGAMGVMQLMPGTAAALGVTDAYDARQNIMGGAKYIADKVNQYGGNVELALAAYNAGSGNVEKYGGVPPFAETQNYIQKIFQYMGQDIQTGSYVQQSAGAPAQSAGTLYSSASGLDITRQQYYIEMMKQQMNMRLSSVVNGLFDE